MRIRKVAAVTMAACLAAGALAGCGSKKSDEKVIKIGVFEPTTGENGGGGYQEVLGIRYANEMHPTVNIGGEEYAVKLVEVDNKSDKTEAVNAAQKLVSEKVSVVLGSYGSGVSIAAGQIFADAKIPAIGCSCTNPQVTEGNDYYFRVCFIDPFQGTVMANYAFQNGAKSAAVITQLGDDYSSGLGSYFKEAFAKLGGNIVSEEQFQTNQTDIGICDRIFTRVGASDDLASGQSTFMVEMTEVANILRNATRNSLLVLDEIGRGTSTFDGLSIAWAVIEHISNSKLLGAKTLFATHYHELTELEGTIAGVKNYCIAVKEQGDDIVFLRKIVRGGADKSYGIQVAKLAGVPDSVIARAKEIAEELSDADITARAKEIAEISSNITQHKAVPKPDEVDLQQLSFFDTVKDDDIIRELDSLELSTMTPLDAMNTLYRLQTKLKNRWKETG